MAVNNNLGFTLAFFLILLHHCCMIQAITLNATNTAPNTPGGKLFDQQIGTLFVTETVDIVTRFIWGLFEENNPKDRKNVPFITVYISDFKTAYAYANVPLNAVNVSAPALDRFYFPREKSKFYFNSLMYHEITHLYQWYGNGQIRPGLAEGIADYVMVKANAYEPEKYTKPGAGNRWDEGYGVTERFLEYCDSLRPKFTVELNKKLRYGYNDNFFKELIGKPVDQLWKEYKAKYRTLGVDDGAGKASPIGYFPAGARASRVDY